MKKEVVEVCADLEHIQWSHWMKYMFSKCVEGSGGDLVIPHDLVDRWRKQMNTDYKDLSEQEKESDREWARKVLVVLDTLPSRISFTKEEAYVIERVFDAQYTTMLNLLIDLDRALVEAKCFLQDDDVEKKAIIERNTEQQKKVRDAFILFKGISDKCEKVRKNG